ncbi:MAG TPA: NAD(P)/FAD-dependent oxidoreductase [Pseudonocardia sp.]|nr:NAD(P)/FAD-dependent oxidoreductase [Pseudonocardia sp.]
MQDNDNGVGTLDAIIIGAGITGIHQLYRLREAGFSARILDAGSGVGGTWHWNRYPGARFDSESYTYGYFFSRDLFAEWDWKEHFAAQPETEAYLNFAVDRLGLRPHVQLDTVVSELRFGETTDTWTVLTADGERQRARFVIAATGLLSAPYVPDLPGRDDFGGEAHHTGLWPREPVDLAGKRVAVVGAGASAVQIVPVIAPEVASLTVYQRTANWCTPLNNAPITAEEQAGIKARFDELYRACHSTVSGFLHPDGTRRTFDDTPEERTAFYEELWNSPGFRKMFGNYCDLGVDRAANDEYCAFIERKIRETVHDPVVAERLVPSDHGFGEKRPPMEAGYYAAFNRDNVELVDLRETPLVEVTRTGLRTTGTEREHDVIIWATGFDAGTGALARIRVQGEGGRLLSDAWVDGPETYLGMQSAGFPNLFMAGGPQSTYGNVPRSTESQVEFLAGLLEHARDVGAARIHPTRAAQEAWTRHVEEVAAKLLTAETAWYQGSNIPGKAKRYIIYPGGVKAWADRAREVAAAGYAGFELSRITTPAAGVV